MGAYIAHDSRPLRCTGRVVYCALQAQGGAQLWCSDSADGFCRTRQAVARPALDALPLLTVTVCEARSRPHWPWARCGLHAASNVNQTQTELEQACSLVAGSDSSSAPRHAQGTRGSRLYTVGMVIRFRGTLQEQQGTWQQNQG